MHLSALRHLRKSQYEVRHQSTEQDCTENGWAILVIVHALGAASAQMQRTVYENAGRINNRQQRGEREQCRAEEPTFVLWWNKVQQRRRDRSDVYGKA